MQALNPDQGDLEKLLVYIMCVLFKRFLSSGYSTAKINVEIDHRFNCRLDNTKKSIATAGTGMMYN